MIEEKFGCCNTQPDFFKQTEIMFLRLVNTIVVLVLVLTTASAQQIRVTVLDKENTQPVSMAYVNVYSAGNALLQTEQTDALGVANVKPESYPCVIEVVLQGFEHYRKEYLNAPVNNNQTITLVKKFGSLNEVVVTGLAEPVKLKNALSTYQVITKAQIKSLGAVTLNEALRNQLNMNISNDPVLGSNLRMQGMGGDKVKVLVDGMPLNGREAGNINMSQINMNNVERIEVIQGPMSVAYGADAIAGVINVITKKDGKRIGGTINTYYETVGKYNADASFTYKLKERHQFSISGGRNFFDGEKNIDVPQTSSGITINTKRAYYFKPVEQYLGNFAYRYTAPSSFNLRLSSDFVKDIVTNKGSLQTWDAWKSNAFDEYYYTTRSLNRLSAEGKLGKTGRWQSQNSYNIYYRIKNRYDKNMVTLDQNLTTNEGDQDTTLSEYYTSRSSYINKIGLLQYTVGYDVNLEFVKSLKIDSGSTKSIQDYALYTNISYALVKDKLTAQAGLRGAYNTMYTAPVTPSFNLLFTPKKNMQVRASYSKGYRAPSLKELHLHFFDANHKIQGNPDIKPENSNHIQLSASYQAYENKADYLQLSLSSNYNEVRNGIVLVPLHPEDSTSIEYKYGNMTHLSNLINTFQVDGQWSNLHIQTGVSYAYTFEEKGNYKAFSTVEVNTMLQYSWRKIGTNFNLFYKFSGKQPGMVVGADGAITYQGTIKNLSMLDASAEKRFFNNKVQIVAGIKNILNVDRRQTSGLVSTGTHTSNGTSYFMPRSFFTSLHFTID